MTDQQNNPSQDPNQQAAEQGEQAETQQTEQDRRAERDRQAAQNRQGQPSEPQSATQQPAADTPVQQPDATGDASGGDSTTNRYTTTVEPADQQP